MTEQEVFKMNAMRDLLNAHSDELKQLHAKLDTATREITRLHGEIVKLKSPSDLNEKDKFIGNLTDSVQNKS